MVFPMKLLSIQKRQRRAGGRLRNMETTQHELAIYGDDVRL